MKRFPLALFLALFLSQARASVTLETGDKVDWGSADAWMDGLTEITIGFSIKFTSLANDERMVQNWPNSNGLISVVIGSDEIGIVLNTTGGNRGIQTSALNISTGSWYRFCATFDLSDNSLDKLYVNGGAALTLGAGISVFIADSEGALVASADTPLIAGYDSNLSVDNAEGDYAEIFFYDALLDATTCQDLTTVNGTDSAADIPTDRLFYAPLLNTGDVDDVEGLTGTLTGGANGADHPLTYGGGSPLLLRRRRD